MNLPHIFLPLISQKLSLTVNITVIFQLPPKYFKKCIQLLHNSLMPELSWQ